MLYPYKASKYHCFVGNWESYGNIANVRDLISLIYSHKIPKWGKLNEIIYFYNRVLIRLYTARSRLLPQNWQHCHNMETALGLKVR